MKRFAIIAIFLSLLFVGNAHAENQSTTDYKIEQIKEDIKKLETELKKLEDDVDDSKDNKLENKKDMESLDKRIGDINVGITLFSIFITVLLLGFGFFTYRNAKNDAKKEAEDATKEWIEKEGKSQLEPIIKELRESFEQLAKDKEMEINQLFEKFKQEHQNQLDEQKNDYKQFKETYTNEEKEVIDKNAKESENKDVKTFDDYWNIMVKHYTNKEFEKMSNVAIEAEKLNTLTDIEKSDLFFTRGVIFNELTKYEKAIDSYQKAIEINSQHDNAYNNMGNAYGKLKEYDKAIDSYQKAIEINPKKYKAYYNMFQLQLILNQNFSVEKPFLLHFSEHKNAMMRYKMLKILQMIATNKPYDLTEELWSEKYRDIKLDWGWHELDGWLKDMQDGEIKTKLSEAIEVFKNHNKD